MIDFDHALAAYEASERPPLCPRCGGWDGPALPFCTDLGWTHRQTCARYTFALDVCPKCEAEIVPDRAETQPTTPRARECETGDNAEEAQR